ncbi:MAG TPA: CBS domain-containing protein [Opitutaceae bacterium]|nr:CBS domain-containing protein [Opitutaceae bacterium]
MDTPISALLERKGSVVYSVPSTFSVAEAVAEMNRCRVGAIVVIDRDHLVGIFTERDVLRRVVGAGIDPVQTPVSEVMSTSVMTITPEATIEDTMNVFTQKRCRHLPVVAQNQLVGVVSIGDVTRWVTDLHRTEAEHLKNYIAGSVIA